jgi:hypothetical protein
LRHRAFAAGVAVQQARTATVAWVGAKHHFVRAVREVGVGSIAEDALQAQDLEHFALQPILPIDGVWQPGVMRVVFSCVKLTTVPVQADRPHITHAEV